MQPCILQVGVSTVALQLPIRTQPKSAAKIAVRIKPRFMRFLLCFLFYYNIKAEYCQDTFAIFFLGFFAALYRGCVDAADIIFVILC